MNNTCGKKQVQYECGGYIRREGLRQHLKTIVHQDRMTFPNGFKYDTIFGQKCIAV